MIFKLNCQREETINSVRYCRTLKRTAPGQTKDGDHATERDSFAL